MGFEDLDILLNKECIIGTYTTNELIENPSVIERVYAAYARTHVPLGDTTTYVGTVKKYLTGVTKKAFIGCVVGEYGHGKTSFLVHVWDQCTAQKILCVPPFKMDRIARCMQTVTEWVAYVLQQEHADLAEEVRTVSRKYQDTNLEETARKIAQDEGKDHDIVLSLLRSLVDNGKLTLDFEHKPGDFLDFLKELTEIVQRAGWKGLLVLVDEPQHAVGLSGMSSSTVFNLIFDWADGVLHREGNYGIFLAMPQNFFDKAVAQVADAVSRLQSCNCLVMLKELYGQTFAHDLWNRYTKEFNLGKDAILVAPQYTLDAIGQVGSSDRADLSYGPRTVVSAFKQMVYRFKQTGQPYQPSEFVGDCLNNAVYVLPEYAARVQDVLDGVDAHGIKRDTLLTLAAFPNGLTEDTAVDMGVLDDMAKIAKEKDFAYHKHRVFGLSTLRKSDNKVEKDELKDCLEGIANTFSPSPTTFRDVRTAFIECLLPRLFVGRKGKALSGWDSPKTDDWKPLGDTTLVGEYEGSFEQTSVTFPRRTVLVTVGDQGDNADGKYKKAAGIHNTKSFTDLIIQFSLRWDPESEQAPQHMLVDMGENTPQERRPARIALFLDLTSADGDSNPAIVYPDTADLFQTAFGTLHAIAMVDQAGLSPTAVASWFPMKEQAIRWLIQRTLGSSDLRTQATELSGRQMPGDAVAFLGSLSQAILSAGYQTYHTLIRQIDWDKRLDDYINALKNVDIPMSCKRGGECWTVLSTIAASTFRTNAMSLYSCFAGFDELVQIVQSPGKPKYVDVSFHIHPHETYIMDKITSSPSTELREIDGKLCPCVKFKEVKRDLMFAGYCELEIMKLIEIGHSRGTFEATADNGEQILFCRPLDPVRAREALTNLLDTFENLQTLFLRLTGTTAFVETGLLRRKLETAKTKEEFDNLEATIRGALRSLEATVPSLYASFKMRAHDHITHIRELAQTVDHDRLVHIVTIKQKASSSWVAALNGCVGVALSDKIDALRESLNKAAGVIASIEKVDFAVVPHPIDTQITDLLVAETSLANLVKEQGRLDGDWTQVHSFLSEYEEWLRLLTKSDGLQDQLVQMTKDSSHKQRAKQLLNEFHNLCDQIDTYLRAHNVLGLQAHGQYETSMEEIDKSRSEYLSNLRTAFEEHKSVLADLVASIAGTDASRPKTTFDSEDDNGSYARLEEEAAGSVHESIGDELREAKHYSQELHYADHVLNAAPKDEAKKLDDKLRGTQNRLQGILSEVNSKWLDQMLNSTELSTVAVATVTSARDLNREARKSIAQWNDPTQEKAPSQDAQSVLDQFQTTQQLDLKDIILQLMDQGAKPDDALNKALQGLVELFKQSRINVQVKTIGPLESGHHASERSR